MVGFFQIQSFEESLKKKRNKRILVWFTIWGAQSIKPNWESLRHQFRIALTSPTKVYKNNDKNVQQNFIADTKKKRFNGMSNSKFV